MKSGNSEKRWYRSVLFQIIAAPILIFLWAFLLSRGKAPGKGTFDTSIKDTRNLIAYIRYPLSEEGNGDPRNADIYLLNSKSGEQLQLTRDHFEDDTPSWSPDGTRLVFGSRRKRMGIARNLAENPLQLQIYDFRLGKEFSLEKNIKQEVIELGKRLRNKGYKLENYGRRVLTTYYPHWFSLNRIGFQREVPYGYLWGSGVLCTVDSTGKNLKANLDMTGHKFKYEILVPQWVNEDTVVVSCREFGSDLLKDPTNIAIYVPEKERYFFLTDFENDTASEIRLSYDKTILLFKESISGQNSRHLVLFDMATRTRKQLISNIREGVFSPKNQKIAFIRRIGWHDDIYIMNSDGTNIKRMTFDGGVKYALAWCPNSDD